MRLPLYILFTMYSKQRNGTLQPTVTVTALSQIHFSLRYFSAKFMNSGKIVICGAGFLGIAFNAVILLRSSMLTLDMDIKGLVLPKQLPWRTIPGQH